MKHKVLKVHPRDNVIVALTSLSKGETISFEGVDYLLPEEIPAKHKFFMQDMKTGDEVIMYGVLVAGFMMLRCPIAIPEKAEAD